jgi:hypothetical protein
MEQLPVLPPTFYGQAEFDFILPRVLELTYTSHAMAPFARDLGHTDPPFPWDEDRRAHLRAELDAFTPTPTASPVTSCATSSTPPT